MWGEGHVPTPPGQPLPPGVPATPFPMQATFQTCFLRADGRRATRYTLSWPAVSGATRYTVFLKDDRFGMVSDVATLTGTTVIAGVVGLPGARAWASVMACNTAGCSYPSNQVPIDMLDMCAL